ncbi:farnesyl pyrophosphate synthase-like isoform X2 [Leptopilina heterotoma]|uniref:farnesyl pyrophosphate synthase-like isoform X2 n=1 Tax=Leptopilina heterotoma TaxID=63436 RepID=UPI001CAA2211|nr:farnesyl pyrophosphate synthase-like isoform X2 [Leptopilina heterotoma]
MNDKSVNIQKDSNAPQITSVINKDESRELMAMWPDVVRDLTKDSRFADAPDITKWLEKMLQYNVPKGKMTRATDLVYAYKQLAPPDQVTDGNIRLARILGWCNEMLQAFFLMEDDIMDHSKIRRGQPCWYLHNDIGLAAVNDGILVEQMIYQLLQIHFREKSCYLDLVDTFHENIYLTAVGQSLDLLSTNNGKKPNLNIFTMDRYKSIIKYKTAYYTCVLPVVLAMHLAGIKDSEKFKQATNILLEIGIFFQIQDDYLDSFGDSSVTGKIGTDVEEGKCTWLVVVALERVTPAQRKILEECYGENDSKKIAKVKDLYNELGLQTIYSAYEEESYNLINTHIKQMSCGMPRDLFLTILHKFYRRNM